MSGKNSVGDLHVVLVEPEIPQNTGNIARTCAATGASLHLIEPLGFSLSDRYLRRAGLDYWELVSVRTYQGYRHYVSEHPNRPRYLLTKKAGQPYTGISYVLPCSVVLGKETEGLPEDLLQEDPGRCVRIPMVHGARSLNLSNAAALVVYEVLRQHGYPGLVQSQKP